MLTRIIGQLDPSAVREPGKGRAAERLLAGFNAFSAPVFDHEGRMRSSSRSGWGIERLISLPIGLLAARNLTPTGSLSQDKLG